jgi:RNA polymerase sigma-70 factor (ECF subfamily)
MAQEDQGKHPALTSANGQEVTSLVSRARAGDRVAFELLVGQFQDAIFRMVYYRTRSRMDAEDLTQEIFMKAMENLSKLRDLERFRSWLFSIAVNRVRDFHRKRRVLSLFKTTTDDHEANRPGTEALEHQEALNRVMRKEFWEQVKSLSQRLSGWEREVFFLRFMDHLGIREIAEVLNKSESTIKTHLYRALKKFKEDAKFLQLLEGERA